MCCQNSTMYFGQMGRNLLNMSQTMQKAWRFCCQRSPNHSFHFVTVPDQLAPWSHFSMSHSLICGCLRGTTPMRSVKQRLSASPPSDCRDMFITCTARSGWLSFAIALSKRSLKRRRFLLWLRYPNWIIMNSETPSIL